MRLLTKQVFEFHELSEKAKAAARKAYVETQEYPHQGWWVMDDFIECAKCLGIEFTESEHKEPTIYFELHCQGAGASFEGDYKNRSDCVTAIKAHALVDKVLISIAEQLTALQVRAKFEYGDTLMATIESRGGDCHSGAMSVQVYTGLNANGDPWADPSDPDSRELTAILRSFADWIYKELEAQYDSYFENDYIDECLDGSEFDEFGAII